MLSKKSKTNYNPQKYNMEFGPLVFRQLFDHESSNFTYLIADKKSGEAILIDPVFEQVERDLKLISELNLKLKYLFDTHVHADHITGAGKIRSSTKAQIVMGKSSEVECADILLSDSDNLKIGEILIKAISTPGHTSGCTSFLINNMLFTGDSLLIRGCGRTDFQGGSSENLFHSIREKLFRLPDETLVFPSHDYKGMTMSTIGEEKQNNPRFKLSKNKNEYLQIMSQLILKKPNKISEAIPRNMQCGLELNNHLSII